jgi:DNA mismatch repair protein MutS
VADELFPQRDVGRVFRQTVQSATGAAARRERRAVLTDFAAIRELGELVERLYPRLSELQTTGDRETDRDLLKLVWRLGDLALIVEIVEEFETTFTAIGERLTATSLRRLAAVLEGAGQDPAFRTLRTTLPGLRDGIRNRQSVTVGVNLDDRLRPVEAVLLEIHGTRFESAGVIETVGRSVLGNDSQYRTRRRFHISETPPGTPPRTSVPLAPLFQDLDEMLRGQTQRLARGLRQFTAIRTETIAGLLRELALFDRLARGMQTLRTAGYPVTIPSEESATDNSTGGGSSDTAEIVDVYDPVLAFRRIRTHGPPVVPNALAHHSTTRPAILTGPNNGGKTTFVRAVGIAHVLYRAGFFVPAAAFSLAAPAVPETPPGPEAATGPETAPGPDATRATIATHFAGGESEQLEDGRFAEEARTLARTLASVTPGSVLLLNETFSSTGSSDALELATELLELLRHRECLVLFATHLYDLPARLGDSAVSLTIHPDTPFRIVPGRPDGHSLAKEVARNAGLDFDALRGATPTGEEGPA